MIDKLPRTKFYIDDNKCSLWFLFALLGALGITVSIVAEITFGYFFSLQVIYYIVLYANRKKPLLSFNLEHLEYRFDVIQGIDIIKYSDIKSVTICKSEISVNLAQNNKEVKIYLKSFAEGERSLIKEIFKSIENVEDKDGKERE